MTQRIGFIGLGRMGQRMAGKLLDAGFPLVAFDLDGTRVEALGAKGAAMARSPRELAAQSDFVITSVTDGPAVLTALLGNQGLLAAAQPGLILIEMSTIGVDDSRRVAHLCNEGNIRYVRAPVLGTLDAAASGTLNALISGPRDAVDDALPILAHLTSQHSYLGPAEEGRVMKLVMNGMLGVTMASFAEMFVIGEKAGLDVGQMLDIVTASGMGGPATRGAAEMIRNRELSPRLSASLMLKDLRLLGELAASTNTPIAVTAATQQLFAALVALGLGELDRAAIVLLVEKLAGIAPNPAA